MAELEQNHMNFPRDDASSLRCSVTCSATARRQQVYSHVPVLC